MQVTENQAEKDNSTDASKEKIREKARAARDREQEEYAPEPEDFCSVHPWPSLADAALTSLAGQFVNLATRKSEADPAAVLLTFLVRFGVECGPNVWLAVGDSKQRPRVNAVIVGASGKSRKGTSAEPVRRLFDGFPTHCNTTPGPLSSGEGIIHRVRDAVQKWVTDKDDTNGRWVTIDPGVDDKRLSILDEEFGSALKAMKREGNNLSTVIRCIFDSGNLETVTKVVNKATNAHVAFVSHITVQELHKELSETENLNGFSNRILWTCARRQSVVPFPEPMPEFDLAQLRKEIGQRVEKASGRGQMNLAPSARQRWAAVYAELSADKPGIIGGVTNRSEVMALRLALVYALLDGSDEVDADHLESALAVWAYCEASAKFIFGGSLENPHAAKILAALKKSETGTMTLTEIRDLFDRNLDKKSIQAAINTLTASGKIVVVQKKNMGKGRPSTFISLYDLNDKTI